MLLLLLQPTVWLSLVAAAELSHLRDDIDTWLAERWESTHTQVESAHLQHLWKKASFTQGHIQNRKCLQNMWERFQTELSLDKTSDDSHRLKAICYNCSILGKGFIQSHPWNKSWSWAQIPAGLQSHESLYRHSWPPEDESHWLFLWRNLEFRMCGFEWNVSSTIGWLVMKSAKHFHVLGGMKCDQFVIPWLFLSNPFINKLFLQISFSWHDFHTEQTSA